MKTLSRVKPYKADEPFNTIHKIRSILKDLNIFTTEHFYNTDDLNYFSCRVTIDEVGFRGHDIGTNGKGLTPAYALASAYGEFMERLQNGFICKFNEMQDLFSSIPNRTLKKIKFDNDNYQTFFKKLNSFASNNSILLEVPELLKNADHVVKYLIRDHDNIDYILRSFSIKGKIKCAPFVNLFKKKIEFIPIEIINNACGTNGLCAGNTREEALIQGICEILERYATKQIIYGNIIPPTIPIDYFKDTSVYELLLQLREKYKIIIKDCSLGLNLPVLGLLVIDKKTGKYGISLGSDPSAITALERCLTEMHQGEIEGWFRELIFFDNDKIKKNYYSEFLNQFKYSRGEFNPKIFSNSASYDFKGFQDWISVNDKEDLCSLINKIKKLKLSIYVLDTSSLGFPSYRIYIPSVSEIKSISFQERRVKTFLRNNINIFLNITKYSKNELVNFTTALSNDYTLNNKLLKTIFFYNSYSDLDEINTNMLLFMLNFKIENYEKAFFYYNILYNKMKEPNIYYKCIYYILFFLKEKNDINKIFTLLGNFFSDQLLKEIKYDIAGPKDIFKYYIVPKCFDCKNCEINNYCLFAQYVDMYIRISTKQYSYETNFSDLFSLC